jgi:hypothetical protein
MSIDTEATTTTILLRAKGPVVGEGAVSLAEATAMTSPQPDPDVADAMATSSIHDKPPQGDLTAAESRAEEEHPEAEVANTNSDNKEQATATTSDVPRAPGAPEGVQIYLEPSTALNVDITLEGIPTILEQDAAPAPETTSALHENRNGESAGLDNTARIEEGLEEIQNALAAANVPNASVPQLPDPFDMPPVTMEEILAANQFAAPLMDMPINMGFGGPFDAMQELLQVQNPTGDMNGALPQQQPHLDPSPDINGYVHNHIPQQQDMHDEQYADHDAPRVEAYAKLQFEDGEFYMNSQSLMLGRDEDGYKAAIRRERKALKMAREPTTPVRSTRGNSRLSEEIRSVFSGFNETGEQEREGRRRRRKATKKSKSESSSQRDAISSAGLGLQHSYMATYPPGYFDNVTDPTSIRPSNDCPFVGIHPPADQTVAKYKALSRNHMKISFNPDKEQFEATFLGRNGGFCQDVGWPEEVYFARNTKVALQNGTVLQIGGVIITFILPDAPVGDGMHDYPYEDEERARSDLMYSEGGKEMSFDFAAEGREGAGSNSSEDEAPILTPDEGDSEDEVDRSSDDDRSVINGQGADEAEDDEAEDDEVEEDLEEQQPDPEEEEEQPAPVKKSIERKDKSNVKSQSTSASKKLKLKLKNKDKNKDKSKGHSKTREKSQGKSKTKESPAAIKQEKSDESPTLPKKRGPGRPPKDGIMSKREQRLAKKAALELEESQKAGKTEEASESPAPGKNKVGRPRKYPKPDGEEEPREKRKYTKRKPKELKEGEAEGEGSGDDEPAKEKKEKKPPKPPRSPTPQFDIASLRPDQLEKPPQNYVLLIHEALTNSATGQLSLPQIYRAIQRKYPYFTLKTTTNGWQSSVRHNLGQNDAFKKCERDGKGWTWGIVEGVPIEKERKKRPSPPPFQGAQPHQPIQANYPPHMMQQQPYYGPPPPGYPPNFQPHPNFQHQHGQPPPYIGQHPQHPQHPMQMNGVPPQHMQMNGAHTAQPFLAAGIASQLAAPKPGSYSSPYAQKAAPPATPQENQQAPANEQKPPPPPPPPSEPSQPLPSKVASASPAPLGNVPAPPPPLGNPQQPNPSPQPTATPLPPPENEHTLNVIEKFKNQLRPHLEKTFGSAERAEALLVSAANQVLGKSNESTGESQEAAIVETMRRTLAVSNISSIERWVVQGSPQPLANQSETQSTASQQPTNPAGSERPPVVTRPAFLGRPNGTPIPRPPMTAPTMKRASSGSPANAASRPSAPSSDSPAPAPTPNSTNGASTPKLAATEIVQTESVPLVGQKRQRSEEENDNDMRELKRMAPSGPPQLKA